MIESALKYTIMLIAAILLYEIVRGIIVSKIKSMLYRSVREYLDGSRVHSEKYKFMHKVIVKHDIMNDPDIHLAISEHAREKGLKIQDVHDQVEQYIEEIVPFFNLLSYYKIGYWIANFFLNMIYEIVIDRENAEKLKKIPADSVVVFVMNHRSNIDYILVAYMLARQISLSYAVGEWARVWPLEHIFKSFGAYFVRRKFRESLYHLVLEKYVQLISLQGVTQGIFLEGGLSRDGKIRSAKIGILDYIIKIKKNPSFKKELVFIPASINYDWVLEDNILVQEWKKGKEKSGFRENFKSLIRISIRIPMMFASNAIRYFSGRLKQHGYASVSFGDPVFLSEVLYKGEKDIFRMDRQRRLAWIQKFADGIMDNIGRVIPVTPVCITSKAILLIGNENISRNELMKKVAELRKLYRSKNSRLVYGKAFERTSRIHSNIADERISRKKELLSFEEDFVELDQALNTVKAAMDILKRRGMVSIKKGVIHINPDAKPLFEYYSNSLGRLD